MAETRRGQVLAIVAAIAGVVWLTAIGGSPAGAQEAADTVAAAIAADGWYADPAAAGDREQLAELAQRPAPYSEALGFALLEAEPSGSSTVFAEEVLDALIRQGERDVRTVVVISPDDVGAVSDVWDDAAIDRAFDASIDELRTNVTDGLGAFAEALSSEPANSFGTDSGAADSVADDENEGLPGGTILLFVVLGVVIVGSWLWKSASGEGSFPDGGDWGDDSDRDQSRRWRRRSSLSSSWGSSRRSSSSSGSRSRSSSRSSRGRGGRRL